jgi:hypothetical protein
MSEDKKNEVATTQDDTTIDGGYRIATAMSKTQMVPKAFQNKPTDCFLALRTAQSMGLDPLAVMQNMYVVHGTPAFSAKFLIAMANRSGVFKTPIMYRTEGEGDAMKVTAWAIHASSNEEVSFSFSMADAKAENYTKNPKYKSMPQLMLSYRAATLLTRLYCPETTMGAITIEEREDIKLAEGESSQPSYDAGDDIIPDGGDESEAEVVDAEVLPPECDEKKDGELL